MYLPPALAACCESSKIGVANHFIALVVVPENDQVGSQSVFGRTNAFVHGVVGENKIIIQTANCSCCSHIVTPSASDSASQPVRITCH